MKNPIGIMQGRLSAPSSIGPQIFPVSGWRDEFATASVIGFDTIEWLVDAGSFAQNPLLSASCRAEMQQVATTCNVRADSVCAHCVLEWRPFDQGGEERMANFPSLISAASSAGMERIIVPILEAATIARAPSPIHAAKIFFSAVQTAEQVGIDLAFEMDRPALECADFIQLLKSPRARLCYDAGNATSLGRDIVAEIKLLLPLVSEIHLKDRRVGGASQPLGAGDTRFADFFNYLTTQHWSGPFVLETPVLDNPVTQARNNLAFVKTFLT
ncbi:MAG TPA: TIM barrel protein [Opitutales bacterium]|nr:TIM barrel protein [Opitutales bacterium]